MHFCPQCGSKRLPNARFCVECGAPLDATTTASPTRADRQSTGGQNPDPASATMWPFVSVLAALTIFGLLIAYLIFRQLPAREQLLASAPEQSAAAAASNQQFPAGHPKVQLPKEALDFITATEQKARAHPQDLAAWNRLGEVTLRAATIDQSYYATASEAFSHVLKIDPDNLDALRGIGNIDFDKRKYDSAVAAYEHYLSRKPDDADVRTDLGTMLLSSGAADEAVRQYKIVLSAHPDFFEAVFNLGVAYGESGHPDKARKAFDDALKLAPDAQTRARVNQMIASVSGASQPTTGGINGAAAVQAPVANASPTNFRTAVEQAMRNLPVAGDKVQSVRWQSDTNARLLMDNFPMDQMPPFAAAKFIADLKSRIDSAKTTYKISGPVRIEICDAASGRVMQAVTE